MRTSKQGTKRTVAAAAALVAGSSLALAQDTGGAAGGAAGKPAAPAAREAAPDSLSDTGAGARAGGAVAASDLVGLPVIGSDGKSIGQVATVHAAPDGKLKDIEVKAGAILGFGGSNVLVPADRVVAKGDAIQLTMTVEEFKKLKTSTN